MIARMLSRGARRSLARRGLLAAALLVAPLPGCGSRPPAPAPNIVLVIADDLGYPDTGFMGSAIVQTPNLDRLAREGAVFRNAYAAASLCRPSLRALLTGLHPLQWTERIRQLEAQGVRRPPAEWIQGFTTLPTLLRERGYVSFQGGKFWEGSYALAGFDAGMQLHGDGVNDSREGTPFGRETLAPLWSFLDAHPGRPFFVWFAPMLPHVPHDAGEEYVKRYRDLGLGDAAIAYYANVTRFDAVVGELTAELDRRGLLAGTLLVELADNGWDQAPHAPAGTANLDGPRGKRTLYDLGFRTPILLRCPGLVPAGVVRDDFVSAVDLFPTLLDYAGVAAPPGLPGTSLRPLLEGRARWERKSLVEGMTDLRGGAGVAPTQPRKDTGFFVRRGRWHYLWYEGDGEELYDVVADPREERDVSRERTHLARKLRREIRTFRERIDVPADAKTAPRAPR